MNQAIKYTGAFLAGVIVTLGIMNYMTYHDMPEIQQEIYQMQRVCKANYQNTAGQLNSACIDLIDGIEAQGFSVNSDNKGNFWVIGIN
jgi:hypothetical protein